MDSVSGEIKFLFSIDHDAMLHEEFDESWKVYLRVVGDFEVRVGKKILYKEVQFCLVEFAVQLSMWLKRSEYSEDFIYTSMESDEDALFWFKKEWNGWRIGSVHQEYCEKKKFSDSEIVGASNKYIDSLRRELVREYGIDIENFINGKIKV